MGGRSGLCQYCSLSLHISPTRFSPFPFFPLGSTADGNGRDDRGNEEETQKKKYGDGEIWEGNREEAGNGKMRNAGKQKRVEKKDAGDPPAPLLKLLLCRT